MGRKKKNQKQNKKAVRRGSQSLPFIIHASPLHDPEPYPTHTHGLHEMAWPELIFDPQAFGPNGNGNRINLSYRHFAKPENEHLLNEILNGRIVKLTMKDLDPDHPDFEPYVYCYRLVGADFEAVKQAYLTDDIPLPAGMQIVQIWVEGDDFAITDQYYIGGIKF